ncbi:methionine/alanine import family NSS transporter small subunit [Alkalihalobacillus trypoxylicola]|nr:methionine/alanine import family NSS transporter small subunit [Alkalihalobacillus trypoxylicola]
MSTSAIVIMVLGMVILWGGMLLSILNAVRVSKKKKKTESQM